MVNFKPRGPFVVEIEIEFNLETRILAISTSRRPLEGAIVQHRDLD